MPIDNLNFSGINRAVSDYGNAGACEELINLRPTLNGMEPVKPFVELFENRGYDKVYIHKAAGSNNYIAIKSGTGMVIVYRVDAESGPVQTLFYFGPPANFSLDDISVAYTGNYILFSICDRADNFYKNYAFLWDGSSYKKVEADAPECFLEITDVNIKNISLSGLPVSGGTSDHGAYVEGLNAFLNKMQETNKDTCFGPVLIAVAYKTKDGKTFWTGKWMIYNPIYDIINRRYEDHTWALYKTDPWAGSQTAEDVFENFYDVHDYGYYVSYGTRAQFSGTTFNLNVGLNHSSWNEETSMISSVEIYASRSKPFVDPSILLTTKDGLQYSDYMHYSGGDCVILPQTPLKEMNLDKQLMYLQKSIPLTELYNTTTGVEFAMEFGGSSQTLGTTLKVDAGAVTRFGKLLSYNSRYHFYDAISRVGVGLPSFCFNDSYDTDSFDVFVRYESNGESGLLYIGNTDLPDGYYDEVDIAIAPSINATEIIATCYKGINERTGEAEYKYYSFPMEKSSTYNYSICTKPIGYIVVASSDSRYTETEEAKTENKQYYISPEPDAINVTEQYNPFVFDVMNSYLAPGKIIDVQPQLVAVRDVSFGDYPLNVFTDRGAYAILQGSGEVLYGNWRSVSNLVSQSNCVPTDSGTFFLAAGSLWLLAGSAAIQVSDALSRGPHKYIRSCEKYALLSKSGTGYDISGYESVVPFDEYTKGAFLSYNIFRDEIFVSNPNYGYSYVISLKYRQWFKVNYQIKQYSIGDNIAMTVDNTIGGTTSNTTWDSYTIKLSLTVRLCEYDTYSYTMNLSPEEQDNPALVCENFTSAWQAVHAGTPVEEVELDYLSGLTPGTGSFSVENIPYRPDAAATMWTENDSSVRVEYDFTMRPTFHRVIDLSQELSVVPGSNTTQSVLVHMQSRPFSNGYQYTHVHRIVSMVRASLGQNDKMIVALYGSDDLQNWNLLSYASRANVTVSQIRTASAARSWRYYTICIGGVIPVDTVMGPVLVEQQPVVRRIG